MKTTSSRRHFLGQASMAMPAMAVLSLSPKLLFAAPRGAALELIWGGLGYSSPNARLVDLFPNVQKALATVGGPSVMVKALVAGLESSYQEGNGKVMDLADTYNSDDGLLIFCVAFDYEQIIATQSVGDKQMNDVESFIFCQTQVLYLETNAVGNQDGAKLSILYSYPFRVQYNFRAVNTDPQETVNQFAKNLMANPNSLLAVFKRKIASKSFKELKFPKGIKVTNVSFSSDFLKALDFVGIRDQFHSDLVGNALSSSMADQAGMSVIPFRTNQLLGASLASRFKDDTKVLELASEMGGKDVLDYEIHIEMSKMIRKVAGENKANVRIARGMSAFVTVTSAISGKQVFRRKLSQLSDIVIDRISMDENLKAFDLRYMIQMTFKMFDDFVSAVMTQSPQAMASVRLDIEKDKADLDTLKAIFQSCQYDF